MKPYLRPGFLAILALVLLSIPAVYNLRGTDFYTSHDGETHTVRIAQYYQALADGQLPPRFAPSLYSGLGSPIFVYIYPIPYLLGSAVHFLGFSYAVTFKILMSLGFVASGVFAYLWFWEVFRNRKAALFGALFYSWVPYRFLLIYVRASLSELLAYAFLPLAFYSLTKLASEKNLKWTAASAVSLSLTILSQNLVALMSLPIIFFYVLIYILHLRSVKLFLLFVLSLIWSLAIAAVTYLPVFFERRYIRLDQIIKDAFQSHFVNLKQLIYSPWGYGFDMPGTINDQMSFQIGIAHILVFSLSIALITYYLVIKRNAFKKFTTNLIAENNAHLIYLSAFFLLLTVTSVFLMIKTQPTLFVWQHFKILHIIDIPWRLLGIISLAVSFLAAFVVKSLKPGLIPIFFTILVLVANRNHLRVNLQILRDDTFFQKYRGTATQYDEFTPRWRQTARTPIGFDPYVPVNIVEGKVSHTVFVANSQETLFNVIVTSESAKIRVNKLYFPKVRASVDNRQLEPFKDLIISDTNALLLDKEQDFSGLMLIEVPRGRHDVSVKFTETKLRLFANYLSLSSLLAALGIIVAKQKK